MGIFDKAKDLLAEHNDKIDSGIDKAAGLINERTGGQHTSHVTGASEKIKQGIDDFAGTPNAPVDPAADPTATTEPVATPDPNATGQPGPTVDPNAPGPR